MIYKLCSLLGIKVVTGERAKALIPKEALKAYAAHSDIVRATVIVPFFISNGRNCLAVFQGSPCGECSWVLVASAREMAAVEKAMAVVMVWYAELQARKEAAE